MSAIREIRKLPDVRFSVGAGNLGRIQTHSIDSRQT